MIKFSIAVLAVIPVFAQEIIGPIRIHAGTAPFTDTSGQVWAPDTTYVQGISAVSSAPLAAVASATNTALYQTQRISFLVGSACSAFSYSFTVPSTRYRVTLKFAELGTSTRTFSLTLNGAAPVSIKTQVGTATDQPFFTNVTNGLLTVALAGAGTSGLCPVMSAIEIVPQIPITQTDVTALTQNFSTVVRRGPGFGTGAVAFVDSNGMLNTVAGDPGSCVLIDGTTQSCSYGDGETPAGVIDGTNGVFTLAGIPYPAQSLVLTRNGLVMAQGSDYNIADATITFVPGAIPQLGDILQAFYRD